MTTKTTKWMTWFRYSAFGPGFFPGTPTDPTAFRLVCAVN